MPIYGTPPDGGQSPYVEPVSFLGSGAGVAAANAAYFVRFRVGRKITITGITLHVGGASSGNVDVGIYTSSDGGSNLTRVGSAGSTAVGAINTPQTVALSSSVALLPNVDYWVAVAVDNATATFYRYNIGATGASTNHALFARVVTKATSFPLPASVASPSGSTIVPWLLAG